MNNRLEIEFGERAAQKGMALGSSVASQWIRGGKHHSRGRSDFFSK